MLYISKEGNITDTAAKAGVLKFRREGSDGTVVFYFCLTYTEVYFHPPDFIVLKCRSVYEKCDKPIDLLCERELDLKLYLLG